MSIENTCYKCPDRCPEPNCHITCERYNNALARHLEEKDEHIKKVSGAMDVVYMKRERWYKSLKRREHR